MRVNLVTEDSTLSFRLKRYVKRLGGLSISSSEAPLPEAQTDVYVIPVSQLGRLFEGTGRPATWLPVIAYGRGNDLREAFLTGCADYLKEPWTSEELAFRVNRVAVPLSYRLPWGSVRLLPLRVESEFGSQPLSAQEHAILRTLLVCRDTVVSREVLSYAAWGRSRKTGSRAIDMHVSALRRKIRRLAPPDGEWGRIRAVRGTGYTFVTAPRN
ncbi:MAG TPA: winged helix-turn-helix domain-containing protein [Spirochaetia bacterium]|nr:winged helix-turn-helix domain-containing protein [Spirochaetia bacterium]